MSLYNDDGTLLLSISRAGRFKRCARSFYYRYVLKLEEAQTRESAAGDLFHSTLDCWASHFIKTGIIRDAMKIAYAEAIQKRKKEDKRQIEKDDADLVKSWIKNYVGVLENNSPVILGHEEEFEFLIDNKYLVRGAIDRIDNVNNDTIRIVDYKVGNSRFIDMRQVSIYAKALINNPLYKGKKFIGGYVFLKENCRIVEYEITNELIDSAVQYLRNIGEKIVNEKIWKPTFTPLCGWCSYKFQCAKDNNSSGELICL